jgi:hypothetical protein
VTANRSKAQGASDITINWRIPHMQKFNIMRPLLILAVAFLAKSLTNFICILLGASVELADNLSFVAMITAAILTYIKLNKARNKR